MFTVKLYKGHNIKIVEATQVNVYPVGPVSGCAPEPKDRTNSVREVAVETGKETDSQTMCFYVADTTHEKPQGWADCVEFYDSAIIENQRGATTEVVRPY